MSSAQRISIAVGEYRHESNAQQRRSFSLASASTIEGLSREKRARLGAASEKGDGVPPYVKPFESMPQRRFAKLIARKLSRDKW